MLPKYILKIEKTRVLTHYTLSSTYPLESKGQQYAETKSLCVQTQDVREKMLGSEHLDMAQSFDNECCTLDPCFAPVC